MTSKTTTLYPLSSPQQEIWFDQLLHPDIPLYNIGGYVRISGSIVPSLFEQALNQVIQNNDALRLIFHQQDTLPVQEVVQNVRFNLGVQDFSDQENSEKRALEWMEREFAKPFPLYDELLFQFALCIVSKNCYYWFKKYHHLIIDGWGISLCVQRVATAYHALFTKQSLTEQKCYSYLKFVKDDTAYLDSPKFEKAKHYWLDKFHQIPEPLLVRRYATQFTSQTIPSQRSFLYIKRSFYNQWIDFAKANNASIFHVFLGILYCYFVRTYDRDNLVIGLPTLNRSSAAFRQTVGLMMSVLPANLRFGKTLSFVDLIQAIRGELQQNYRYQRFPISESNRNVGLYAQNRQQLFELELSYEKHDYDIDFNGSPASAIALTHGFQQNSLTLFIREFHEEQDVQLDFDYNLGAFQKIEIELLKARLEWLLTEILRYPEIPIQELQLMPEAEIRKIRIEFNDTIRNFPLEKTIVDLFEAQVEQTPHHLAVVLEKQSFSYQVLNSRANQLAHYLQSLGVKPEVLVGLYIERSLEMVIGLLGILKAGGAYVPLDPSYPKSRLALMLEDSQVPLLLTQSSLKDKLPKHQAQMVCLDTDWASISQFGSNNLDSGVVSANLAYVIYTSGSTGKPKGVQITHQSVTNFLHSMQHLLELTEQDVLLAVTTISFDIAVLELYLPLTVGAKVVLVNHEIASDGTQLRDKLNHCGSTVMQATPATWRMLLMAGWNGNSSLKILVGGEALSHELASQLREKGEEVWNLYGPTETTVWSASYKLGTASETLICDTSESIGCPIANTQIYILDRYMQLAPIGVPGELHIGGAGVARGYLNRSDLTAEKFIPNFLATERTNDKGQRVANDSRLYKTGDLARYLPDGNIEYLGRIDNQVKIRGFRIELGEIETVLSQHSGVRETVVMVHSHSSQEPFLVAYLVPNPGQVIENTELRRFLTKRLPHYMIPAIFVPFAVMPLTPNGKIDRRALPKPDDTSPKLKATYVMPQTETEQHLAALWQQVLQIEKVGIEDNFLELGGHSLLATQLLSRIRDTFGVELPLSVFFEGATIADLAQQLSHSATKPEEPTPFIVSVRREQALPLSFAQQRLWFLDQLEGNSSHYNEFGILQIEGPFIVSAWKQSLTALMERHEILRTTFSKHNEAPVQIIAPPAKMILPIIDLQALPTSAQTALVHHLAGEESQRLFDLTKSPLIRFRLLWLGKHSYAFFLTVHHIIFDGWSKQILIHELLTLYQAFSQNQASNLAPLPIQYADFASWQRQWLTGKVLDKQLHYWKTQLAGAPALLQLPTDYPRPAIRTFQGRSQKFAIDSERTNALQQLSQQSGTTLFMILLASFATLLSRYSGMSDIVIGSPIANRTHSQIESLIGFFVNTLVLRIRLEDNPCFEELLTQVRKVALDAYAHQEYPFEQLVEELKPERNLSHTPLFQVMFVLQNAPMATRKLSEMTLTLLIPETSIAKFDLTLSIEETTQGLTGHLEYNTDLFEHATITRMIGHFQTLLEGIVTNPHQPIQELSLFSQTDYRQLMAWNDTQVDYPQIQCIHQLFERQVEKTPQAVALVFENQQMTYQALNRKANQLAHYLQILGIQPEKIVGICVERGFEMVIGLLGILKAGGAYLPLDPNYPVARLAFMLEDSRVQVLLTQAHLQEELPTTNVQMVCLDREEKNFSQLSQDNLGIAVQPENLAYVIYTSGSTGEPKGVMISHYAISNHTYWMQKAFPFDKEDKILQKTPFSFDASVWEFYTPLIVGAQLVMAKPNGHQDSHYLVTVIAQNQITCLQVVPALLQVLLQEKEIETLQSLKRVFCGGDVLSMALIEEFLTRLNIDLINLYGPTETCIDTTFFPCKRNQQHLASIGHPIANAQVYILASNFQPTPIGIPGELYISGACVARGYCNHPQLTAEKFLPNPFRAVSGERFYRTGDLARYLPDGNIEYLGRIDNQIKIRGFRIELGEIESVLALHTAVRESIVVVHTNAFQNSFLVAYLQPHPEATIEDSELRQFLKEKLPDYMIPQALVVLESLPLTPSGKIDRRTLSQLPVQISEQEFVAPRNSEEEVLAGIWENILGIEPISIHDNFFQLGGHSLLATRVVSRIRETFIIDLPLNNFFQYPTIAELAERVKIIRGATQTFRFSLEDNLLDAQEEEEGIL